VSHGRPATVRPASRIRAVASAALLLCLLLAAARAEFAQVAPRPLQFPADHGSHPAYRTEWWYVTGWLEGAGPSPIGFQITFFRTRPDVSADNPSAFAPRHILIGHGAISDPAIGKLLHDQRIARAGFGLAEATEGNTAVWIDDWRLERTGNGYRARIPARDFTLDLALEVTQPPLLQGDDGFSRKGGDPRSASHYYSVPQLGVSGTLTRNGEARPVTGRAWLDHEWSSDFVAQGAVGWDWTGINLADGGALMAFRMRGTRGESLWAGGAIRSPRGEVTVFQPREVAFDPLREWRSPRTGTGYPVSMTVRAGELEFRLEPLFDDQELDGRASSGVIYWEGAVTAVARGKVIGQGYLELTGYGRPMDL